GPAAELALDVGTDLAIGPAAEQRRAREADPVVGHRRGGGQAALAHLAGQPGIERRQLLVAELVQAGRLELGGRHALLERGKGLGLGGAGRQCGGQGEGKQDSAHGFGSLNGYTASGFAAVYPRRESRRHLPPPRNAMPRLTDWLDDPAAASPLLQSLRPHAARLPACAEEARVLQVLEVRPALRADQEVLAAAILHGWPALRAAVPKQALSAAPRLPALLEGLAAADQVHGLHQGRPGHANAEGLR